MRFTLLGTASSAGVPRIGPVWGNCDPNNPKNRRRRCALLVERIGPRGRTRVLVDTPPDVREQLLDAKIGVLEGVLYTHDHADHTHGIDDLRGIFFNTKKRVQIWADTVTRQTLESRFEYCFKQKPGSSYPAVLEAHDIVPPEPVRIEGPGGVVEAVPVLQDHGAMPSLGFRFGNVLYSPDICGIPESSLPLLENLDIWIVDALRHVTHSTHFSVPDALNWIKRVGARRGILTHMTVELDYETLSRQMPPNVEVGYDGMVVEVE
ncbi:MAG TPA: MBL fold metallo-hydrolase [Hyphomicrobiaceae bacterium]|nr:MBL fold metallo-hydrolase [Hyphomicrobiaceae bacterium]